MVITDLAAYLDKDRGHRTWERYAKDIGVTLSTLQKVRQGKLTASHLLIKALGLDVAFVKASK